MSEIKARFRYTKYEDVDEWFWEPLNYEAETLHLMRTYGRTDIGRRFKKESEPKSNSRKKS